MDENPVWHGARIIGEQEWDTPISRAPVVEDPRGGDELVEIRKVIIDGEELEVSIEQDGGVYRATVEGHTFEVLIPESTTTVARKRGTGGGRKRSGMVSASMPGKVVTVDVQVGEVVDEGQTVLILEAMKMQNEIHAPLSGTVSAVNCKPGDSVEANSPLVVITPEEDKTD